MSVIINPSPGGGGSSVAGSGGPPSGPAGGDLSGTYPNPTVAQSSVANFKVLSKISIGTQTASVTGTVNVSGNMGIGTINPVSPLTVAGGIFDVLNSGTPTNIKTLAVGGALSSTTGINIQGNYLYVINNGGIMFPFGSNMSIVDVTNPNNPFEVSTTPMGIYPQAIELQGKYGYVTVPGSDATMVVDLHNPSAPVIIGTASPTPYVQKIKMKNKYGYTTNFVGATLGVLDFTQPWSPQVVTQVACGISASGEPFAIDIQGDYAYIGCDVDDVMSVMDIRNPRLPVQIATVHTSVAPIGLCVNGRYAYVACQDLPGNQSHLNVIDISNPKVPVVVKVLDLTWNGNIIVGAQELYIYDRYLYIVDGGTNDVLMMDVSDPLHPFPVADVAIGSAPQGAIVNGRYMYCANYNDSTISILDLGGIESPTIKTGSINTGSLQVQNNMTVNNFADIGTGLSIGDGGIFSNGPVTVTDSGNPSQFNGSVGIGYTGAVATLSLNGIAATQVPTAFAIPIATSGGSLYPWVSGYLFQNYARIDCTNQPFTGSLTIDGNCNISNPNASNPAASGEYRLTDSTSFGRLVRESINSKEQLLNQVTTNTVTPASGGIITTFAQGNNTINVHTFSSNGNFVVPASNGPATISILTVAGGGSGSAGGGGGGGVIYTVGESITPGTYAVTVGTGGAAANSGGGGNAGTNSVFRTHTAVGGGGGGGINAGGGGNGGSGGGGGSSNPGPSPGGTGTGGQGNNGGSATGFANSPYPSAGGGGAGAPGQVPQSDTISGQGGNGTSNSITGTAITYAGGGGGCDYFGTGTPGIGGTGGGGNGGVVAQAGTNGLGGGGGGTMNSTNAGAGGNGIVIITYTYTTLQEIQVVQSITSSGIPEISLNTFGDINGRTVINGTTDRIQVSGVEFLNFSVSGVMGGILWPTTNTPTINTTIGPSQSVVIARDLAIGATINIIISTNSDILII